MTLSEFLRSGGEDRGLAALRILFEQRHNVLDAILSTSDVSEAMTDLMERFGVRQLDAMFILNSTIADLAEAFAAVKDG